MRRVVVVCFLVGCLSKPGLRDHDGGANDDAAAGDGGGNGDGGGSADAMTCTDGTWEWVGPIVDTPRQDERHPWLSPDGRVLVYWRGQSGAGKLYQVERASVETSFGKPFQIYPPSGGNAPAEADPSLTHDMLTMHMTSNGSIVTATRSAIDMAFDLFVTDTNFTLVNNTRDLTEGGFLTDDGTTFFFVAGDSGDPYTTEDLYRATRSGTSGPFGTPVAWVHNTADNECCPTIVGGRLMYERPAGAGKHEIVSAIWDGAQTSTPDVVPLPGSDSFQQPTLSADGQRLVYVVNSGSQWHLEEAKLVCSP